MRSYQTQLSNYFPSDGNHFMEIYMYFILWKLFYGFLWGNKKQFHILVGAEQAREVVTLVTSEAPYSLLWVET